MSYLNVFSLDMHSKFIKNLVDISFQLIIEYRGRYSNYL